MDARATSEALSLAEKVEEFLQGFPLGFDHLDVSVRRRLSEATRKLSLATESTGDTVHRVVHSPLQLPLTLVGIETRLFEILAEQKHDGDTNAELARKTKVDSTLMKRLLRYYQSFGMIDQPGDDQYRANNITQAMVSLGGRAGVPFYLGTLVPAFNALPQFLRDTGYANITDGANCPWFLGHRTDEAPFDWVQKRPDMMQNFMSWMVSQRDGLPNFLEVIDFVKEFAQNSDDSIPIFVDIGGAMGHQSISLRQKYPELVGRVILQDLPQVIDRVKVSPLLGFEGIEAQVYNFFTEQPLKGARNYYLRNVLHGWPDHTCVEILQNIKPAMKKESKILIDEMVLPERGAPWRATQVDLAMSTCFAAMERSHADWIALLDKAGLKIERVWKYTEQVDDCIIVAIPK
ncbi:hypothetical protein GQX73_g6329 [Xylaria multiplex]|uniref:O-methyltransferase C-terminal domain-containing protein n=1 Tax=Xylaria multiplex TaxID=323545 RepID=A0A7C8MPD5_9PEZI|nr:hypothetical protein GQX73_g6329 [Xylaria multiplex]